ncbi:extensin-like [Zingiber officinale]|uniref:extensin-like n=1 Tax=Zingiber officinale TaxID=94328 RepID=UPI001C4CE016|nr:extensin-like [Zingiber officinale]
MPRRGAGRPFKRPLESLVTESPERSAGIEPLPTPTVSTVPLAVPSATYSAPPPAVLATTYPVPPPPVPATTYPAPAAPVTPMPTAYSAPAPAVPVAPYPVPPPAVPPAAPAYINPAVPPAVPIPAYAAAPGVPPPAYPVVPLVIPALVVPSVPTAIPTHPTDMVTARAQILVLAESMKSRFTLFRGETGLSVAQSWIESLERTVFYMSCFEWEKAELAAYHLQDEADIWWDTHHSIIGEQHIIWTKFREAFESQYFPWSY